jgi:hypothetical protein
VTRIGLVLLVLLAGCHGRPCPATPLEDARQELTCFAAKTAASEVTLCSDSASLCEKALAGAHRWADVLGLVALSPCKVADVGVLVHK